MPDKDLEGDGPSLELRPFGLGRRTRRDRGETSNPDVPPVPDPIPDVPPVPDPIPDVPPVPDPHPDVPPMPDPHPDVVPGAEPEVPARPGPGHAPDGELTARPEVMEHETRTRLDERAAAPRVRFSARELRFPSLPPLPAVLLVGALIGLAAVALTWGVLRMCDVATGTASCGGGPGLLLLVAIMIALTYLGGWLLRGFGIDDAGSTSFLAVSLLAVVAMLFLVDSLDQWSGVLAVPVVAVAAYALSWRVTTTLVDAGADQR